MKTIERRILAVESSLLPKSPAITFLEAGEGPDFDQRLVEAKATGRRVIVVVPDDSARARLVQGVEHMGRFEAGLIWLDSQPSRTGRRNALEDVLYSLSGNVIEVAA